jgi:hypothetical protein
VIANDFEYLCDLEIKAIKTFGTRYPTGYNMTDGGEGATGPKPPGFSDIVSIAQKKRFSRPEELARAISWLQKGREKNQRRHAANRIDGRPPWVQRKRALQAREGSPEHKAKHSAAVRAALNEPDIKEKLVKCASERAANPEWRAKVSASKRGKKLPPRSLEVQEKMNAAIKAAWADPVKKVARIEKNRATRKAKESK